MKICSTNSLGASIWLGAHCFINTFSSLGEFIAVGKKHDMVHETADSILVKEGKVEMTYLFHSNCIISQYCFYHKAT